MFSKKFVQSGTTAGQVKQGKNQRREKSFGVLIAILDYTGVADDEFNDWYDTEHIPERLRIPGFLSGQRWLGVDNDRISVALYDLSSLEVLASPEYRAISGEFLSPWSKRIIGMIKSISRYEAIQIVPGNEVSPEGAGGLLLFAMNVDPSMEKEFNEWYNTEHLSGLKTVFGVLSARRFQATQGNQKYLAVYHLQSSEVVDSPEWRKAAETPWTSRIRSYTRDRVRIVCRPYHRTVVQR